MTLFSNDAETRLAICVSCKEFNPTFKVCGQCGCLMPLKVKFEQAKCPLGFWSGVISNEQ